ncbi:hypothetical protein Tco_0033050 [Tanacetum coccineum]
MNLTRSGSVTATTPQSLAWKTSDTRESPSSSSKKKFVPHSEQPVEDVPMPDDTNISESETDTYTSPRSRDKPRMVESCTSGRQTNIPDPYEKLDLVNPECQRVVPDVKSNHYLSGGPPSSAVRSHLRILSVVSLKTYERYGYTFLEEIVLRRADYKEYKILEADFKNLHPK